MVDADLYHSLGVDRDDGALAVRRAYRDLARLSSPSTDAVGKSSIVIAIVRLMPLTWPIEAEATSCPISAPRASKATAIGAPAERRSAIVSMRLIGRSVCPVPPVFPLCFFCGVINPAVFLRWFIGPTSRSRHADCRPTRSRGLPDV